MAQAGDFANFTKVKSGSGIFTHAKSNNYVESRMQAVAK
jgi:hypothetical protein